MKEALPSDPIVGVEQVIMDSHGPGALAPRPLTSPRSMTPAERAVHTLARLPFLQGALCVPLPGVPIRCTLPLMSTFASFRSSWRTIAA